VGSDTQRLILSQGIASFTQKNWYIQNIASLDSGLSNK